MASQRLLEAEGAFETLLAKKPEDLQSYALLYHDMLQKIPARPTLPDSFSVEGRSSTPPLKLPFNPSFLGRSKSTEPISGQKPALSLLKPWFSELDLPQQPITALTFPRMLAADVTELKTDMGLLKNEVAELKIAKAELKIAKEKGEKSHAELKILQQQMQELRAEKEQLQAEKLEAEKSAVRRQVAINIEFELKCELLEAIKWSGSEKADIFVVDGEWHVERVSGLKVRDAWKMARAASLEASNEVHKRWFGDSANQWDFIAAMKQLKRFSHEGAHPTTYEGAPVTGEMARQFINNASMSASNKKVATLYIDKLIAKRTEKNDPTFLKSY
ncbi:hypothetical protein HDV00_006322 [Rhizophlyctis rosea]|nr:hypothetical protein HDV00_006322 [Rhizophlyctis rosea]